MLGVPFLASIFAYVCDCSWKCGTSIVIGFPPKGFNVGQRCLRTFQRTAGSTWGCVYQRYSIPKNDGTPCTMVYHGVPWSSRYPVYPHPVIVLGNPSLGCTADSRCHGVQVTGRFGCWYDVGLAINTSEWLLSMALGRYGPMELTKADPGPSSCRESSLHHGILALAKKRLWWITPIAPLKWAV